VQHQRLVQQLGLRAVLMGEPAPVAVPLVIPPDVVAAADVAVGVAPGVFDPPPTYACVGPVGVAPPGVIPEEYAESSAPASPDGERPARLVGPPPGFEAVVASGLGFGPAPGPARSCPSLVDSAVVAAGPVVPPSSPGGRSRRSESTWSTWSGGVGPNGEYFMCGVVLCRVPMLVWPFFSVRVAIYYCPSIRSVCAASLSLLTLANARASVCVAVCRGVALAVYYTYFVGACVARLSRRRMVLIYRHVHSSSKSYPYGNAAVCTRCAARSRLLRKVPQISVLFYGLQNRRGRP